MTMTTMTGPRRKMRWDAELRTHVDVPVVVKNKCSMVISIILIHFTDQRHQWPVRFDIMAFMPCC